MRLSRGFLVGVAVLLGAGAVAGCGGGNNAPVAGVVTGPTAPPIPVSAAASVIQSVALSTPAGGATSIPVAVPTVAGYAGQIGLAVPSSLPTNASLAETVSNTAIDGASVPTLQSALRSPASSAREAASTTLLGLLYIKLAMNAGVTFPNLPAITMTVPANAIVSGTSYYLAAFDPLRTSLGWQKAWEGPATISGTTLSFAAPNPAVPLVLNSQVPFYLGLYAVSSQATAPTPAPSISPAPTPVPLAAFSVAPSSVMLLAVGAGATATISDPSSYTGGYAAASSASGVATATVSAQTVTISAVGGGTATITIGDSNGRTASIAVVVTPTNVTVQGGRP